MSEIVKKDFQGKCKFCGKEYIDSLSLSEFLERQKMVLRINTHLPTEDDFELATLLSLCLDCRAEYWNFPENKNDGTEAESL